MYKYAIVYSDYAEGVYTRSEVNYYILNFNNHHTKCSHICFSSGTFHFF